MRAKDQLQADCYLIMRVAEFSYERRRLWTIWAAKVHPCETCEAQPYEPCWNQNEAHKGNKVACRNPHESRVDWFRFKEGLAMRGFTRRG